MEGGQLSVAADTGDHTIPKKGFALVTQEKY